MKKPNNIIYFDNAATSWPKPPETVEAIVNFLKNTGGNPGRSGHRLSIDAGRIIFQARDNLAELFNIANPLQIVFTRNATEALNLVILGMLKPQDHVIVSGMEHNAVMRPLRWLEKQGLEISVIPCGHDGTLDPSSIRGCIRGNTRAAFITHASNVTGTIMPLREIAAELHKEGIPLCADAAQTAGALPLDVIEDGIDLLAFTGHKSLMGPQGTGGLYIRPGLEPEILPLMRGGTGSSSEHEEQPDFMPDRYESGTPNTSGLAGLASGTEFILRTGIEKIRQHEIKLTQLFTEGLKSIPGITCYGPGDMNAKTAVVSITSEYATSSDIAFFLDEEYGIMCRPGLHCAPSAHKAIGTHPQGTCRFSFSCFNNQEEIKTALKALEELSSRRK